MATSRAGQERDTQNRENIEDREEIDVNFSENFCEEEITWLEIDKQQMSIKELRLLTERGSTVIGWD